MKKIYKLAKAHCFYDIDGSFYQIILSDLCKMYQKEIFVLFCNTGENNELCGTIWYIIYISMFLSKQRISLINVLHIYCLPCIFVPGYNDGYRMLLSHGFMSARCFD